MGNAVPVIQAVASIIGAGSQLGIFGGGGKKEAAPAPQAPPVPQGPPPDQERFEKPAPINPPAYLAMGTGLTPIQQRAMIATRGSAGDDSAYRDPETLNYYRNIVLNSLVGEGGGVVPGAEVLPVERQYLQSFGESPRTETPESFLSALLRAGGS